MGDSAHQVMAERDRAGWRATISGLPSSTGCLVARDLADVEAKALRIVQEVSRNQDVRVEIRVTLPPVLALHGELIAGLSEDLDGEMRTAYRQLTAFGLSPLDTARLLARWCQAPRPSIVTSGEVAALGLSRHPEALGLSWDDRGQFRTSKCRRCVEADLDFYRSAPPGEEHALVYEDLVCDFCDTGHPEDREPDPDLPQPKEMTSDHL